MVLWLVLAWVVALPAVTVIGLAVARQRSRARAPELRDQDLTRAVAAFVGAGEEAAEQAGGGALGPVQNAEVQLRPTTGHAG